MLLCNMSMFMHADSVQGYHSLKSQVVLLQTAHSWANAGVLLGARMHRERVAFETIKGRCWSKTGVCHISLSIQQILIKFTAFVYCMKILQIVKFDLICIMVAMVTDRS